MNNRKPIVGRLCLGMAATIGLVSATGCNQYALFDVAGFEQSTFSNDADIVFVIDNSNSMEAEAAALGLNFNSFIEQLTNPAAGAPSTSTLSDAVDNYVSYTTDRGSILDYQIGITTPSVKYDNGPTTGIDPGEHGTLVGDPAVIVSADGSPATDFRRNLLCETTCWNESTLPLDPDYECGADPGNIISLEYLDCICGLDEWQDHCGSGQEEPLEAALLALCRSVPIPPDVCYEDVTGFPLDEGNVMSNPDLVREDSTIVVAIVTDEGDGSRRIDQGSEDASVYIDAYADFDRPIRVAVIGPYYDPETRDGSCLEGALTWGVQRLMQVAGETNGFYSSLTAPGPSGDCQLNDFAEHLNSLGDLLNNLLNVFKLQAIPDESTIRVYVNGDEVDPAPLVTGAVGDPAAVYGDGWIYDPSENAVTFTGAAIPDYNSEVRIFFRPLEGKPRELPF